MFTFLILLTIIVIFLLVLLAAVQPTIMSMSGFELERRARGGNQLAKAQLRRSKLLGDVVSLVRAKVSVLLVTSALLLIVTFGWAIGVVLAIIVALEYSVVARVPFIKKFANGLYVRFEPHLLNAAEKHPIIFRFLRSTTRFTDEKSRIDSREELQHLVASSEGVLTHEERALVVHSLAFGERLVSEILVPRTSIVSINHSEFLGPLTLDELHQTGHSRLPVIRGDIDHVVGILHLQSLLALDNKRSVTAEKAMEAKVHYIRQDQTLHHALAAFLRTHHHLFIVVNEFRETVGLLTLEDVIEALLGRKIVDEFDAHDDVRTVALRNPADNNEPKDHTDV